MSEENQQQSIPEQQPVVPVQEPTPPVVEVAACVKRRGILEDLPKEVKEDMEAYIRSKNPHAAIKYMRNKYGERFPELHGISKTAIGAYAKRHNVVLGKEIALQKDSAVIPPETLDVINKITDPSVSLQDKRAALTALYNACETRNRMLMERQINFIDPQLEALILANRKEQRVIIEKIAVLNDQLTKEADKDFIGEMSNLVQVLISSVITSYKLTHQDQVNYSMFMSTLTENFTTLLKSYTATKENLKKESN
jgi:hypothetical protein